MDPFWELFEEQFCTKYEKMRTWRVTKNRCRKKAPPITQTSPYDHGPGLPDSPPSRARFLNKKQQFEQQKQQQEQQLQQLWLNVDFCFENCPIWVETRKKGCWTLLESKGQWSDTPWAKARRILKVWPIHHWHLMAWRNMCLTRSQSGLGVSMTHYFFFVNTLNSMLLRTQPFEQTFAHIKHKYAISSIYNAISNTRTQLFEQYIFAGPWPRAC